MDRIAPTRRPVNRRVAMRQSWRELLFLHWEVDPAALQRRLPPGLSLDTFEGRAFIGVVPFTMRDIHPMWAPPVPWLSHFHEINVRTYVHREGENPGVWFFSLDAANPIAVEVARGLWKLPYHWARMSLAIGDEWERRYETARRNHLPLPADASFAYRPAGTPAPASPGSLDFFLLERYLLYAFAGGRLRCGQVHHTPYPMQGADLIQCEADSLLAAEGFPNPGPPALVHYAAGVDVEIFPLRPAWR